MAVTDTPESNVRDEDDLGYTFPSKPSELRGLADDELAATYRKLAYPNRHPLSTMVEQELSVRLVAALVGFKRASDRASRALIQLTLVLVILTAVLVWLTIRL